MFSPPSFNPILVWFYPLEDAITSCLSIFQSHLGLILSFTPSSASVVVHKPFNPILVWFYLEEIMRDLGLSGDFQSHLGLILSCQRGLEALAEQGLSIPSWSDFIFHCSPSRYPHLWHTFNPILVWFYLILHVNNSYPHGLLSIPSWSDFIKRSANFWWINGKIFQSHLGLILSESDGSWPVICLD